MNNNNTQVNDGYDEKARPFFISPLLSSFSVLPILHSSRYFLGEIGGYEKRLYIFIVVIVSHCYTVSHHHNITVMSNIIRGETNV